MHDPAKVVKLIATIASDVDRGTLAMDDLFSLIDEVFAADGPTLDDRARIEFLESSTLSIWKCQEGWKFETDRPGHPDVFPTIRAGIDAAMKAKAKE